MFTSFSHQLRFIASLILLNISTFGFTRQDQNQKLGQIQFEFENYNPSKHGKYKMILALQGTQFLKEEVNNLQGFLTKKSSLAIDVNEGLYQVVIKIRSNYSLTITNVKIQADKTVFIKINLKDCEKRMNKIHIRREFRE